jgi:hypothetical protein
MMDTKQRALCYRVPIDEGSPDLEEAIAEAEQYARMLAARDGATITGTWTRRNEKTDVLYMYVEALAPLP